MHSPRPGFTRRCSIARQSRQGAPRGKQRRIVCWLRLELTDFLALCAAISFQGRLNIAQLGSQFSGPTSIHTADLPLGFRIQKLLLQHSYFLQLLAIHKGRQRITKLLVGQPRDRDQECQNQHHILGHLGPGDGPHAAQKGANQNPAQAEQNADFKLHAGEARSDQANAINLGYDISE